MGVDDSDDDLDDDDRGGGGGGGGVGARGGEAGAQADVLGYGDVRVENVLNARPRERAMTDMVSEKTAIIKSLQDESFGLEDREEEERLEQIRRARREGAVSEAGSGAAESERGRERERNVSMMSLSDAVAEAVAEGRGADGDEGLSEEARRQLEADDAFVDGLLRDFGDLDMPDDEFDRAVGSALGGGGAPRTA